MARQLSSSWTWFNKFVFPPIWIGIFGSGVVGLFLSPGDGRSGDLRWPVTAVLIAGVSFLYWAVMRLKRVTLEGGTLSVSNYLREIHVPLCDVERVSASIMMNPELIWLHFRGNTLLEEALCSWLRLGSSPASVVTPWPMSSARLRASIVRDKRAHEA
jgi:hypothetical protein